MAESAGAGTSAPQTLEEAGLALVADMVRSVAAGDPSHRTLGLICRTMCELAGFSFCGVLVPDAEWRRFDLAGGYGFPPAYVARLTELFLVATGEAQRLSPTRQAAEQRTTIVNPDVLEAPSFAPWRALALEFGYRSMVSIPLLADDQVIGVLNGYSTERRDFSGGQLVTVETLAAHAAVSLRVTMLVDERQETIRRLRSSNEELERQRRVLERAHEIHQRLTAAVLAGTDAPAIARALSELIERPVAVTDRGGQVVCTSGDHDAPEAAAALAAAVASLASDGEPTGVIVGAIRIPGELLGHVVVVEGDSTSSDLDQRAVEHAATVLALETVKERVVEATSDRLRADFLTELFRGRLADDQGALDRARRHGLRIGRDHRVVVAALELDPDAG